MTSIFSLTIELNNYQMNCTIFTLCVLLSHQPKIPTKKTTSLRISEGWSSGLFNDHPDDQSWLVFCISPLVVKWLAFQQSEENQRLVVSHELMTSFVIQILLRNFYIIRKCAWLVVDLCNVIHVIVYEWMVVSRRFMQCSAPKIA